MGSSFLGADDARSRSGSTRRVLPPSTGNGAEGNMTPNGTNSLFPPRTGSSLLLGETVAKRDFDNIVEQLQAANDSIRGYDFRCDELDRFRRTAELQAEHFLSICNGQKTELEVVQMENDKKIKS